VFGLCFLLLVFLGGCVFAGSTKDLKPVCFWCHFDIFDFIFLDEMGWKLVAIFSWNFQVVALISVGFFSVRVPSRDYLFQYSGGWFFLQHSCPSHKRLVEKKT